eukprot:2470422-Rhodomonas_salina.1
MVHTEGAGSLEQEAPIFTSQHLHVVAHRRLPVEGQSHGRIRWTQQRRLAFLSFSALAAVVTIALLVSDSSPISAQSDVVLPMKQFYSAGAPRALTFRTTGQASVRVSPQSDVFVLKPPSPSTRILLPTLPSPVFAPPQVMSVAPMHAVYPTRELRPFPAQAKPPAFLNSAPMHLVYPARELRPYPAQAQQSVFVNSAPAVYPAGELTPSPAQAWPPVSVKSFAPIVEDQVQTPRFVHPVQRVLQPVQRVWEHVGGAGVPLQGWTTYDPGLVDAGLDGGKD